MRGLCQGSRWNAGADAPLYPGKRRLPVIRIWMRSLPARCAGGKAARVSLAVKPALISGKPREAREPGDRPDGERSSFAPRGESGVAPVRLSRPHSASSELRARVFFSLVFRELRPRMLVCDIVYFNL